LALVRQYWEIETGLHYRRDVTLKEDATRLTLGNAGHIMAILNNAVIGLCLKKWLPEPGPGSSAIQCQTSFGL